MNDRFLFDREVTRSFLHLPFLKEVVPFVVANYERGKVFDIDFPNRLHS